MSNIVSSKLDFVVRCVVTGALCLRFAGGVCMCALCVCCVAVGCGSYAGVLGARLGDKKKELTFMCAWLQ